MTPDEFRAQLDLFKLSQTDFAKHIDVSDRTIRRWASGEIAVPTSILLLFKAWTSLRKRNLPWR